MDANLYYLILSVGIIVSIFFYIAMKSAYRQGLADGKLQASLAHTELLMKQLANQVTSGDGGQDQDRDQAE